MSDFERLYDFAEQLDRHFSRMRRAIEVCTVQNYSFDLSEDDERKLNAQWRSIAGRAAKEGKEIVQIQLCETPIEEEMCKYLVDTDAYFRTFGEKFRVISQEAFQRMSNGWDLTDQFWIIDGRTAIISSFAEDGELMGNEEVTDRKLIGEIAGLSEKALSASLPPDEFIRKYG